MIKTASGRTFEYTPREGSNEGKDRHPAKLLTDAVFFCVDHYPTIFFILLILLVFFIVKGQIEATPISQNFTG